MDVFSDQYGSAFDFAEAYDIRQPVDGILVRSAQDAGPCLCVQLTSLHAASPCSWLAWFMALGLIFRWAPAIC